jgi:hypothetical protein
MYARVLVSLIVALVSCPVSSSARAQCPDWKPGFKLAGPNDQVAALATLDIGSGPELYALGGFSAVDEMPMKMAAKWDGVSWKPLGDGLRGPYVGLFEHWALAAFDDGSGPAVYAGGTFLMSGTAWVNHVAKWDGARWSPLGAGTDGPVEALAVYDDGDGPSLIAGGSFTTAGGVAASNIARWDGTLVPARPRPGRRRLRARPPPERVGRSRALCRRFLHDCRGNPGPSRRSVERLILDRRRTGIA